MNMQKQNNGQHSGAVLPTIEDFSPAKVRRAVRKESMLHPLVLYPSALGVLSGFAAMLYDLPLLFLGMGGLLALGAASSVVNYFFRSETLATRYINKLAESFHKQRQQVLADLQQDLAKGAAILGAEQYARQGGEQYRRVEKKYLHIQQILKQKFKVGELAYGSFFGASEQVYFNVLDNLLKMTSLLQSVEAIDPTYVDQRKTELATLDHLEPADERELVTLDKRLALRVTQLEFINALLTENEESMTVLDETITAVAAVETQKGLAEVDLETAMSHLREVAERAQLYNHDAR